MATPTQTSARDRGCALLPLLRWGGRGGASASAPPRLPSTSRLQKWDRRGWGATPGAWSGRRGGADAPPQRNRRALPRAAARWATQPPAPARGERKRGRAPQPAAPRPRPPSWLPPPRKNTPFQQQHAATPPPSCPPPHPFLPHLVVPPHKRATAPRRLPPPRATKKEPRPAVSAAAASGRARPLRRAPQRGHPLSVTTPQTRPRPSLPGHGQQPRIPPPPRCAPRPRPRHLVGPRTAACSRAGGAPPRRVPTPVAVARQADRRGGRVRAPPVGDTRPPDRPIGELMGSGLFHSPSLHPLRRVSPNQSWCRHKHS